MDYNKVEDSIFKKAMEVFRLGASEFFNLNITLDEAINTEIKNIDIKTNHMDYLFKTDKNDFVHFEFQTTDKKEDLSRFLYYDASLYYKFRKRVNTYVVYSSNITTVVDVVNCGSINYSINTFFMKNLDGDSRLKRVKEKIEKNEFLTESEVLSLSLIPLMESIKNKSDITLESIEVANNIKNDKDKMNCLSMLYALFDKFGDIKAKKDLRRLY